MYINDNKNRKQKKNISRKYAYMCHAWTSRNVKFFECKFYGNS